MAVLVAALSVLAVLALPGCQATAAPGENGGARCGSQRPSCVGGSGAGHVVAVARPVMSPGAQPS